MAGSFGQTSSRIESVIGPLVLSKLTTPFQTTTFAALIASAGLAIGLFVTTINTLDNIKTFVGNGKIFGDNIQNFSANPYRRVDLVAQLNHSVDANQTRIV